MTKLIAIALFGLSAFAAYPAQAAEQTMTLTSGSAATFNAVGKPGFLRINGEGAVPQGTIVLDGDVRLVKADLKVPLGTLKTGIDLRDEHMKNKYLDVGKFPDATFHAADVKLPAGGIPKEMDVPGSLTIHGVTKQITAPVTLSRDGQTLTGETEFEVKLSDYGIDIPSFMGVTVAETVKIHCKFAAK